MNIGLLKETFPGETRVALIPKTCHELIEAGQSVSVELGAGLAAGYTDDEYQASGASICQTREELFKNSQWIVTTRAAGANAQQIDADLKLLSAQHSVIAMLEPLFKPDELQRYSTSGAQLFSLEMMPRITRAQSMDVLSAMASAAGYQAVLLAATRLQKFFPMLMTAAGTIRPAKVLILGAGVMGLQAIATARRLGAVVQAYDVRPVVKEQVESLGGTFVELNIETESAEDKGGYAKAQSEEFYNKQRELLTEYIKESDVVITTALIPGRTAPILLTKEMVGAMRPGSIVIDGAAEKGGNCELTLMDQEVTTDNHVLVLGPGNLPAQVAYHASQMMSNNIHHFLQHLLGDSTEIQLDLHDEIINATLVAQNGQVRS